VVAASVGARMRCCRTWCPLDGFTRWRSSGALIAVKVMANVGLRPIAEHLDVPHTPVRTWWRRFQARSPTLVDDCSALAVALVGTSVMLTTSGERAALHALQVACRRAHVRFGEAVGNVWRFWSRISGGQALGTNTTSPWARGPGADWMAASHFGGHVLERRISNTDPSCHAKRRTR